MISVTEPAATVLPALADGEAQALFDGDRVDQLDGELARLSPGMTICLSSGSSTDAVMSVVRK